MSGQAAAHLFMQVCSVCRHGHLEHYRSPSCRLCGCRQDPLCGVCQELTSTHEDGALS